MLGVCLALSCLITVCLPFVITSSLPLLFFLQFVQGALDGAVHPCAVGIMSAWTTKEDKGRVFAITFGGPCLAPSIAAVLSGLLICYVRWDGAFFVMGVSGIAFSVVWTRTAYNTPEDHPSLSLEERDLHRKDRDIGHEKTQTIPSIPLRHILTSLPVWSIFVGYFCRHFLYTLTITALAQYFTDVFQMNIGDISLLATLPHIGLTVVCLLGGVVVDKLLSFGLSLTLTRKIMFTAGMLTEGLSLLGLRFTKDWRVAITLITVGVSMGGLTCSAGHLPMPGDLTPVYAGVVSGVASTGSVSMLLASLTASQLVGTAQDESGWQQLFLVAGLVSITGALFFSTFAEAKHQPWSFGFASSPAEDGDVDLKSAPSEKDKLLPETKI